MGMKERNRCFFVGDQDLPAYRIKTTRQRLEETVDSLVREGVRCFFASGIPGFELLAAEAVIRYRMRHPDAGVQLVFIPPGKGETAGRPQEDLEKIGALRETADQVLDPALYPELARPDTRRCWLADHSMACVTYFSHLRDCNSDIICYARLGGVRVIHLGKSAPEQGTDSKRD